MFFDFHNVISRDLMYGGVGEEHARVREFVDGEIFGRDSDLPDRWMRGELKSADINQIIGAHLGIDRGLLAELQAESVRRMRLETRLLELSRQLRAAGIKTAIVSDNMDIFTEVAAPHHGLRDWFDDIINSAEHGFLKSDAEGALFDIAMGRLGESDYGKALLIDDSARVRPVFEKKGGTVFTYTTFEQFEPWMKEHLAAGIFDKNQPS